MQIRECFCPVTLQNFAHCIRPRCNVHKRVSAACICLGCQIYVLIRKYNSPVFKPCFICVHHAVIICVVKHNTADFTEPEVAKVSVLRECPGLYIYSIACIGCCPYPLLQKNFCYSVKACGKVSESICPAAVCNCRSICRTCEHD